MDITFFFRKREKLRNKINLVIFILFFFFVLRVCLVIATPSDGVDYGDLNVYHKESIKLSTNISEWLLPYGEFGYRAPLYFCYLALVYKITGANDYRIGQFSNLFLVIISCLLLYSITKKNFGQDVGIIAVLIRLSAPFYILSDIYLLSEPLFEVLLLSLIYLYLKENISLCWIFWVGVLSALLMLTREYAQFLVVILFIRKLINKNKIYKTILVFLMGFCIITSLWMWRNTIIWRSPFPLMLTSGVNLHVGNNPDSNGTWNTIKNKDHKAPAEIKFGTREADSWHRSKALEYIFSNPFKFIKNGVFKLGYLSWPNTHNEELRKTSFFNYLSKHIKVILVAMNLFGTMFLWMTGLLGAFFEKDKELFKYIMIIFVYTIFVVFIFFGSPRFASPIISLLIPFSAHFLYNFKQIMFIVKEKRSGIISSPLIISFLLFFWIIVIIQKSSS